MNITEMSYVKRKKHDEQEHISLSFIGDSGVERLNVNIQTLCYGINTCYAESGLEVEISDSLKLSMLQFAQKKREELLVSYPIKTFAGWVESGLSDFSDYCKPNDKVDREMVDYFRDVLPPTTMKARLLQSGDPHNYAPDENGRYRETYTTFAKIDPSWIYMGNCFEDQSINRATSLSYLEQTINSLNKMEGAKLQDYGMSSLIPLSGAVV